MYVKKIAVLIGCLSAVLSTGCQVLQNAVEQTGIDIPGPPISVVTEATKATLPGQKSLHLPLEFEQVKSQINGELLGSVLAEAYPASRFTGLSSDDYNEQFVSIRNGITNVYAPLALVHRYELRDYHLAPGAVVDVFQLNEIQLRFSDKPADLPERGRVTIAGLVNNPGTVTLGPNSVQTLGQLRSQVNERLDEQGQDRLFDVMIVNRPTDSALQQLIVPFKPAKALTGNPNVAGSAKYDRDFRNFAERTLERTALKDGDVIQFARMSLLPSVVSGRVRQEAEEVATQAVEARRARRVARREQRRTTLSNIPGASQFGDVVRGASRFIPNVPRPSFSFFN